MSKLGQRGKSGCTLQEVKVKTFRMGKENQNRLPTREYQIKMLMKKEPIRRESTYILKQKYAQLRHSNRLSSSRQQMGLTFIQAERG